MEAVQGNSDATPRDQLSSSSQNPFEYPSDTTNKTNAGAGVVSVLLARTLSGTQNSFSNNTLGLQSILSQPVSESPPGNPFQEPTNTTSKTSEDQRHSEPLQQKLHVTVPPVKQAHSHNNALDEIHLSSSQQTFPAGEQGYANMVNSNTRADSAAVLGEAGGSKADKNLAPSFPTFSQSSGFSSKDPTNVPVSADTNVIPKRESGSRFGAKSSENDIPISSLPKHGDGIGQHSAAVVADENRESGTKIVPEIQNPPTQVMEHPADPNSTYTIPAHVFAMDKSNTQTEWSACSNESLFSIHMGNMSFSNDLTWFKSGEFSNPGETNMSSQLDGFPSSQPPASPNPPTVANLTSVKKLNDISPRTDCRDESPGVTEAKAAETMREVIRENTEKVGPRDFSFREAALSNRLSHKSEDGSSKSFVFPILARDGNKSRSSKGVEEKPNQQTHSELQTPIETPILAGNGTKSPSSNGVEEKPNQQKESEAETPKDTPTAAQPTQNRWLSCFTCCTFCR